MNMPGFTAEASVYAAANYYSGNRRWGAEERSSAPTIGSAALDSLFVASVLL